MRRPVSILFLSSILAGAAHAQGSFVVPGGFDARTGNSQETVILRDTNQPVRVQLLFDTGDIPVVAAQLQSMDLRRPAHVTTANPAANVTLTVDLSVGPNAASAADATFANNLGTQVTRVFSGNVNLPALSGGGPQPAPWSVPVPFSAPFAYVAVLGNSLVADISTSGYTATSIWRLDAATARGNRVTNTSQRAPCLFSNGNRNSSIGWLRPHVGGNWYVRYSNLIANAPGVGALGSQGSGGSWGGVPLPIDLSPLGAPGCLWSVNVLFTQPLTADAAARAQWPTLTIPNDLVLASASFFDHALFIDPPANAAGIVTVWSSEWIIGAGSAAPYAKVVRTQDTAGSPTGTVSNFDIPILRFNH